MRDHLTAIMVDDAVMTFGIWYENRSNETDEKGRPIYTPEELLADEVIVDNEAALAQLEGIPGFLRRRKSSVGVQVDDKAG